jgi:hypothetical protein
VVFGVELEFLLPNTDGFFEGAQRVQTALGQAFGEAWSLAQNVNKLAA